MSDPYAELRNADLDELLERPAFLRVLWDMLSDAGWMHGTFTGDALTSAFREGRRDLANQIMDKCLARRGDTLIRVLQEGRTTLAPLIQGPQAPDERSSYLHRDGDDDGGG